MEQVTYEFRKWIRSKVGSYKSAMAISFFMLFILIDICSPFFAAASAEANPPISAIVNVQEGGLNLREKPDFNAKVITLLPNRTKIKIVEIDTNELPWVWVNIPETNYRGYVHSEYLIYDNTSSDIQEKKDFDENKNHKEIQVHSETHTGVMKGMTYGGINVEVRESPTILSKECWFFEPQSEVIVTGIDDSGDWLEVNYGWVMREDIALKENPITYFGQQGQLCFAIKVGNLESVKKLVVGGANVNGISKYYSVHNNDYYDTTFLDFAVMNNNLNIVQYLLEKGADVNLVPENGTGLTSLHWACIVSDEYDNLPMVKLLVSSGANINITDKAGNTPCDYAFHKNSEVTDFFRSKGAEFAIQEEDLLASAIEEQPDSYENIGHIETQSATQSFRKTGVTNVTAKTVGELWHSNRFAFDREYKGKEIILEGTVGRVSESDNTMRVDLLSTEMLLGTGLINCYLQTSESNKALKLQVQDVKIQGRCMVEQGVFGDDELAIRDCVILEMPQQQVNKVVNEGTIPEVSLETLRQEMDDNEPKAMNKYEGKRVILKCTWDRVEKGDGDLPELKVMDFSSMCMASCLLRRGQEDYVARLDISSEIVINAIFNGGDCGWTGLKFRDGLVVK